jgi:ribosomal protein L37E
MGKMTVTEQSVIDAMDTEFDGVDKFDIVQELLGLRARLKAADKENAELKSQKPPCGANCYHHQTHPCEKCGRISGYLPVVWKDKLVAQNSERITKLKGQVADLDGAIRHAVKLQSDKDKRIDELEEILENYTLPDNCEVCHGRKGGVRGNENRIDGKVMCDYCTVEFQKREAQE